MSSPWYLLPGVGMGCSPWVPCRTFGPIQNIRAWRTSLSSNSPQCLLILLVYRISTWKLVLCFIGPITLVAVLPIITLLASVAYMNRGSDLAEGWINTNLLNTKDHLAWTKYTHGCFDRTRFQDLSVWTKCLHGFLSRTKCLLVLGILSWLQQKAWKLKCLRVIIWIFQALFLYISTKKKKKI